MRSKKLISLLCAAAMTASSFAALSVTAGAADDDLFSYDDGSTSAWTVNYATLSQETDEDDETDTYIKLAGNGSGFRTATYSLSSITSSLEDNYVIEFDSMIHASDGQGRESMVTQIAFYGSTMATDTRTGYSDGNTGQGVGTGFAVKYDTRRSYSSIYTDGASTGVVVNDPASVIESDWTAYSGYVSDVQDVWTRTQAVVDAANNTVTITMIDAAGNKLIDGVTYACDAPKITGIYVGLARGDSVMGSGDAAGPGYVYLDNIRVYNGDAETLSTDGLKGEAAVATPYPAPETKDAAPVLTAPDGVTVSASQDFSTTLDKTTMTGEDQTITTLDGLSIAMGSRTSGDDVGDNSTYVQTAEYASGDKVLELVGGRFSNQGRGPEVSATTELTHDDTNSVVMMFAANITSEAAGGAGRLYILGTDRQAGDDNNGAYNAVMAVLATDDYEYFEGEGGDNLVIQVEPYTWYKVGVVVSSDKYRVYVAKAGEDFATTPDVNRDHVGQGDSNIGIDNLNLPILAVTSASGSGSATNSFVRLDNLLTYTGSADEPRYLLASETEVEETEAPEETVAPTEVPSHSVTISYDDGTASVSTTESEAFNGVLIAAKYCDDGTLDGVSIIKELTDISSTAQTVTGLDLAVGDKLFVWNSVSGMVPYGSYTVSDTDTSATQKPGATVEPTTEVTTEPTESTEPEATATTEPEATATTEPEATATT
ncbi:MAG: hypothetical protein LUF26_06760, partial [Firmicutes bacterium]|nr:hypothetical protein [Bacillota bacterium]